KHRSAGARLKRAESAAVVPSGKVRGDLWVAQCPPYYQFEFLCAFCVSSRLCERLSRNAKN
ncbi:MAG: hypothetical protein FWB99_08600, partial [Treponema sp.]|nr:hypothetical protein [Treponema sp.]